MLFRKLNLKFFIGLLVLVFLLINNIGHIYDLFSERESSYLRIIQGNGPEFNNKADYIDSACDFTYIEFYLNLNEVEKQTNSNVSLDAYNETTGKIECHNRLIKSNANNIILNNSNENFAIAFGVFEDFENLERSISFNLVFLFCSFLYTKDRKINQKISVLDFKKVNVLILIYSFVSGAMLTSSVVFWFTTLYVPFFVQTNIFNIIYSSLEEKSLIKSIVTMSIFPLLFFHSHISFYATIFIVLLSKYGIVKQTLRKTLLISAPILLSFFVNFNRLEFKKIEGYDSSVLLQNGLFQNSIVNTNDGFKSTLLQINIIILLYLFFEVVRFCNVNNINFEKITTSYLNGFLIWSLLNLIVLISPLLKLNILNLIGINKFEKLSFQFMWSGFNNGYEMTSFWFLVCLLMASYKIIYENNYIYILHFILLVIFSNMNGSRTALTLFILFLPLLALKKIKQNKEFILFLFLITSFVGYNLIFQQTTDRFVEKTIEKASENRCDDSLERYLLETEGRTEYEIKISSYDLNFSQIIEEKLNTLPSVGRSVNLIGCVLGRQVEWSRYLIISEFSNINLIFGHGYGQSYETLIYEIEKPHSLLLTLFYQVGAVGVLYFLTLCISFLIELFKKGLSNNFLQIILFVCIGLNALKTEFIFLYWGTTFSLLLIFLLNINLENYAE